MSRIRKTTGKHLPISVDTVVAKPRRPAGSEDEPTETDSAPPVYDADAADTFDEADADDESTIDRGSNPPRPSSSRRISPTLMRIFQRRRKEIGLSLEQLARLSGVSVEELTRFENTQGQHRLVYDHAIVLARILGLKPSDMPGLRGKEGPPDVATMAAQLERAILSGPLLVYEGTRGERFGGPLERAVIAPAFGVQLADATLGVEWPRSALLGFVIDPAPRPGEVVIIRHRRTKQLALRRLQPPTYVGLAPWQPAHPASTGSEWTPLARLHVILPRG